MNELAFSKRARDLLKHIGFRFVNLQSCKSEAACPDLFALDKDDGKVIALELKILRGGCVKFRPGQTTWLSSWEADGGRSLVVVFCPNPGGPYIWVLSGSKSFSLSEARRMHPASPPVSLGAAVVRFDDGGKALANKIRKMAAG